MNELNIFIKVAFARPNVTSFQFTHPRCVGGTFFLLRYDTPLPSKKQEEPTNPMFSWKKQNPPSKQRQQQAQGGGDYSDLIAQGMQLANEDIDESGADTGDYMGDEGDDDFGDMDLDDPELLVIGSLTLSSSLMGNKRAQDCKRKSVCLTLCSYQTCEQT